MKYFHKLFRPFTNKKVKTKLLGTYLIATVIPILLVGLYLNYSMRDVVLKNAINDVDANVDKLEMRLNAILDRAISISDLIYINDDLKKLLNQEYESNLEIYTAYQNHPIFDEYLKYYSEVENIRFYMTKEMITDSHFIFADADIQKKDWYQTAVDKKGYITWEFIEDSWTNKTYLTLTRAIYGGSNELLGVLNIYISPDDLSSISKQELFDVFITLDSEVIVHSKDRAWIGEKPPFIENHLPSKENESFIYDSNLNEEHVKIYLRSFQPKKTLENLIQISAIIPIQDVIKDSNNVLIRGFIIVIFSLIVSISLIVLFIRSFNRRIYTLRNAMDNVAQGKFSIKKQDLGGDEIGEVYRDLDKTVESIQQLIEEVYIHKINEEQWKRRQKESEFKMLASQINPHFLYNTLEMIRMKAIINNDHEVADIVKKLSKMMRSSLEVTDQPISLQSEIDLVTTYLDIQKMRFGDRFNFEVSIYCNIATYQISPLLLQPLVENSVIHGVAEKEDSFIQVIVLENNNKFIIQVIDNGVGIEKLTLSRLEKELSRVDEEVDIIHGIGLHNVNKRIKLYYGEEYGISIKSELGQGTTVTLSLPIAKGADGYAEGTDY